MKKYLLNSLFFLLLIIGGCKKIELEEPVNGSPVFVADFEFENGETLFWEAGVDSLYMYTEFDFVANGIHRFIGRMEKENCAGDCKESLSIIFRNSEQIFQGLPNVEQSFENPRPPFFNNDLSTFDTVETYDTSESFQISLAIDTAVTPVFDQTFYEWYNGSTFISSEMNPVVTYTDFPNAEFMLRVTDFTFGDSCVAWQRQFLAKDPVDKCAVIIESNYNVDFFLESLQAIPVSNFDPFVFGWNNGVEQEINTGPFQPGSYYEVTLTNANDVQSTAGFLYNEPGPSAQPLCGAHFDYSIESFTSVDTNIVVTPIFDSIQLSAVTIIYKDKDGREFRSDRGTQNSNASFTINNVEDYFENENGHPTKKLDLEFNCRLWDANQNEINIVSGNATWGIAYPD